MDELKLKNCPFCGGEAERSFCMWTDEYCVHCNDCGARITVYCRKRKHKDDLKPCLYIEDYDDARHVVTELWNRRTANG